MGTKNAAVGVNDPGFTRQPIHNQTFNRWANRVRPDYARAMLESAFEELTSKEQIRVVGPRAGAAADAMVEILIDAGLWLEPRAIAVIPGTESLDDNYMLSLNGIPIQAMPEGGPALRIFDGNIMAPVRFYAALQLFAYSKLKERRPIPQCETYLTVTGIVAMCALHGVVINQAA